MTGLDTATTRCQKLCGHLKRGAATNCPWQTSSPHRGRKTISEVQIPPSSSQTILTERFQRTETLGLPWSILGKTCTSISLPHSHLLCLHISMLGGSVYSTQEAAILLCHRGESYLNPSVEHLAPLSRRVSSHIEDHQPRVPQNSTWGKSN